MYKRQGDAGAVADSEEIRQLRFQFGSQVHAAAVEFDFDTVQPVSYTHLSTLGRATTAARAGSRSQRHGSDVGRAEETLTIYRDELQALEAELEQEVELLHQEFDHQHDEIETIEIAPRKMDCLLYTSRCV